MKTQRLLVALTLVNCALLSVQVLRDARWLHAESLPPVLRGRALEIVDDHGRIRASLYVLPADSTVKMPNGTRGYPESVLLRLQTSTGGAHVKLQATEDGAGFVLGGSSGPTFAQILTRGDTSFLKLSNKSGQQLVIKP